MLSNKKIYEIFKSRLSNQCDYKKVISDGIKSFDSEAIFISAIDAVISCQSIDLYKTLVNDFYIKPEIFEKRLKPENISRFIIFMRQVKLNSLLG